MPDIFEIILANDQVFVRKEGSGRHLLSKDDLNSVQLLPSNDSISRSYLGEFNNIHIKVHVLFSVEEVIYDHNAYEFIQSKPYLDLLDTRDHLAMLRALHLNNWHRSTKYCGKCGNETHIAGGELFAKSCQEGHKLFPSYSPAIVAMVIRKNNIQEDEVLLVRKPTFPPGLYTHVAGFLDPGESFEEAVIREVKEETGVTVSNIKYFGDQSWPFPSGHMIGFQAEYLHGDIIITDTKEIEEVKWFSRGDLRKIKNPAGTNFSISNKLTQSFLNNHTQRRYYSTSVLKNSIPENFINGISGLSIAYLLLRYSEFKASGVSPSLRLLSRGGPSLVGVQALLFSLECSILNTANTRVLNLVLSSNVYGMDIYRSLERYWPLPFGVVASLSCILFENTALQNRRNYQPTNSALPNIFNRAYFKQSFSGVGTGMITCTSLALSFFTCYPYVKNRLIEKIDSPDPQLPVKFAAGLGTNFGMNLATQPLYLFRTHQQREATKFKSETLFETTKPMYGKSGARSFYRGLLPRTFWFATAVAISDHVSEKVTPKVSKFF